MMMPSAFVAAVAFLIFGYRLCVRIIALQPPTYLTTGFGNNQFATKTSYFWTHPESDPVKNELMNFTMDGRTCNAVYVNVVSRHGARYTSLKDMRSFSNLQRKLKQNFSNKTFNFINTWVNNYPEEKAELLSALGEREMHYIGKYFGTELNGLLTGTVSADGSPASLQFTATRKTRTVESANFFFSGLTLALLGQTIANVKPDIKDNILRFYDNCERYEKETSDLSEQAKFENGPIFQKVVTDVTRRLGSSIPLTIADVKMIYRICATELAIMNNADWCALLADADREVLEYDNDIEDYITRFHGHEVTGQMSCPLGREIFTAMDNAIAASDQGSSYAKGTFQFGHSDTIIDFAAGLGLFKESDTLRADNYHVMKNRKFRASILDPFSTHFAFILYNCGGTGADNYALKLFFNGKPLTIPKCNSDICWYNDVRQNYTNFIDDCDWNSICATEHNPSVVG